MALLLAMFQKFRLVREKNQLTLDLVQISSKLTRVQKNIERQQKRFTSLFSQLESQAKLMQSQATMQLQTQVGLGCNGINPYDYTGITQFVFNNACNLLKNKDFLKGANYTGGAIDPEKMFQAYMKNSGSFKDANGNYIKGVNEAQAETFNVALQQAKWQQQQAQAWVQQTTAGVGQNISVWLEAQKAQLEYQQDAMLEPLNYEETMLELDKTSIETRLKRIEAEEQSYDQLVSKEAERSAPSFGLG